MSATQKLLRFSVFELNLDTEELFKSGIPVKLPPQPLKLLVLLASRAGQVVARGEIQEQLWIGETFVDFEHGVNKCINQIRTVLGDNAAHPIYIQTLPRRGYRFIAPVVSKVIPTPQPKVIESGLGERSRLPVWPPEMESRLHLGWPLFTDSFPWASMGIALGVAAVLGLTAFRVVQTREY